MAKVLIVDDMMTQRKTLGDILTNAGFTVVGGAKDGVEAIEAYQKMRPDLVLMDIHMPRKDGISALKEIKLLNPEAKVVMCSVEEAKEKIQESIRFGASDYIVKPYDPDAVAMTVRTVLGTPSTAGRGKQAPFFENVLQESPEDGFSRDEFIFFRKLIYDKSGLFFNEGKRLMLYNRIQKRCKALGMGSTYEYYRYLQESPNRDEEFVNLYNIITTNLTHFFRERQHLDALRDVILPELRGKRVSGQMRILSAGCSTGEEPYSIAITLLEAMRYFKGWEMKVYACDICRDALDVAREGTYLLDSVKGSVEEGILENYFVRRGKHVAVREEVKGMVEFYWSNLSKDEVPQNLDVIFCRNVMIYFDDDEKMRILEKFHRSLNPGGYLIVGRSETIYALTEEFDSLKVNDAFIYKRR
ncbi:MAG: CheR family methyltransferase [bacterium]